MQTTDLPDISGKPGTDALRNGDHCYVNVNFLKGLINHVTKDDRDYMYNPTGNPNLEFIKGVIQHYCTYSDLVNGHAHSFHNGWPGHEKLLRSKLPLPIYSSSHIIWGQRGEEFTGMKVINYFDGYRPLAIPVIFTLEFH